MRPSLLSLSLLFCALNPLIATAQLTSVSTPISTSTGLTGLRVGPNAFPLNQEVLKPFVSDGCSMSPDGIPGTKVALTNCCVAHDIKYWLGGTKSEKDKADLTLRACIQKKSNGAVAQLYYRAVQTGGSPALPHLYRWGYGWNFLRPFSALSEYERLQAEFFYGKNLNRLMAQFENHQIVLQQTQDKSDPSLIPLQKEDLQVYEFLNRNLKTDSILTKSSVEVFSTGLKRYHINLQDCSGELTLETSKTGLDILPLAGKSSCLSE